jgi:uncharacterized protein
MLPFYFMHRCLLFVSMLSTVACADRTITMDDFRTRLITLPNGKSIRAEVVTHPTEMMRGMMFRDSLAEDRGMLFVHGSEGQFPYWMYQVRIPLDIIWLDRNQRIVEISAKTPPCPSAKATECPQFGGQQKALFILELAGGVAAKHGLKAGDVLNF